MMENPEYYKMALGISYAIPRAETLRQRMDDIGSSLREVILQANVDMFKTYHIKPTPLPNGFMPVDIDVTPFDNSKTAKEGVSRTYKGFDGYAPMMAYIGTEGFLVNCVRESSIVKSIHLNFAGNIGVVPSADRCPIIDPPGLR